MITDRLDFGPIRGARAEPREQQIETAVRDFEAQLLRFLVKGMRQAFLEEQSGPQGLYSDFAEETITQALAAGKDGRGLGLAKGVRERLQQSADPRVDPNSAIQPAFNLPRVAPPLAAAATPKWAATLPASPARPLQAPADAPAVNSGFGRRVDPLHGAHRFHRGIDLKAASGTPVLAAAAGTVLRTDDSGGYGNHVIVGHPGGYETLYAHLSSIDVQPGNAVAAGTQLGAAGATGRATGPHLHFELRAAGHPIDPTAVLGAGGGWQWPVDPSGG